MMNYSMNNLNLDFFNTNNNNYNTSTINTEYGPSQTEDNNIFSPINTTNLNNINILELSSLKNNYNTFHGVKVKKLKPNLTINLFAKNANSNKKTLVLDLDETLVHSSTERPFANKNNIILNLKIRNKPYKIYVILRPYLEYFLKEMSMYYNLYIFTASMSQYSTALLDILDRNKLIVKAFNREHCQYKFGFYFKDLSIFNIDYKDIIIIDNNPVSYALNKRNGIPILTWLDDPNDKELIKLIPVLKYLSKVDDVRPIIKKIVNRDKSKINFTLFNKLLNKDNAIDLSQNNEMNKNILYQTKTLKKKSNSKLNIEDEDSVNLITTYKKNNKHKKIIIEKKNIIQNKNVAKENNSNIINKEKILKKIIDNKYIEEKKPENKIRIKENKPQPNVYNISIGNIKNIQNNIRIVLKNKNKIVVSKLDKPKGNINNKRRTIKSINIIKHELKPERNNSNLTDIKSPHNEYIDISKSLNLNNPSGLFEKKPLDKDEKYKKGPNDLNVFYFSQKNNTMNLPNENLVKTNVFFNNTLRKNKYFNFNDPYQHTIKNKFIVMKIIKKTTNKNDKGNIIINNFNNTIE